MPSSIEQVADKVRGLQTIRIVNFLYILNMGLLFLEVLIFTLIPFIMTPSIYILNLMAGISLGPNILIVCVFLYYHHKYGSPNLGRFSVSDLSVIEDNPEKIISVLTKLPDNIATSSEYKELAAKIIAANAINIESYLQMSGEIESQTITDVLQPEKLLLTKIHNQETCLFPIFYGFCGKTIADSINKVSHSMESSMGVPMLFSVENPASLDAALKSKRSKLASEIHSMRRINKNKLAVN